jgi:hypothetical protein
MGWNTQKLKQKVLFYAWILLDIRITSIKCSTQYISGLTSPFNAFSQKGK